MALQVGPPDMVSSSFLVAVLGQDDTHLPLVTVSSDDRMDETRCELARVVRMAGGKP